MEAAGRNGEARYARQAATRGRTAGFGAIGKAVGRRTGNQERTSDVARANQEQIDVRAAGKTARVAKQAGEQIRKKCKPPRALMRADSAAAHGSGKSRIALCEQVLMQAGGG